MAGFLELDKRIIQMRTGEEIRREQTPHGRAQRAVDTALEMSQVLGTSVRIDSVDSESGVILYNVTATTPRAAEPTPNEQHDTNRVDKRTRGLSKLKVGKHQDVTGLTGFYKGTFYKNGRPVAKR